MSKKENNDTLRYERKFLITAWSYKEVEQMLRFHPSCFSEIFHQRQINNIYFDSLGMDSYYDNVEGEKMRTKVRIRWYGELFGKADRPVLEFKIKKGLLGKKLSFPLEPFHVDKSFDLKVFFEAISKGSLPGDIKNELLARQPLLLNSYSRKYFLSADKKFRVTIDHQLSYYRIAGQDNQFLNKRIDRESTVLELKYNAEDELAAKDVGASFPFPLTKNSKYLKGIESVML